MTEDTGTIPTPGTWARRCVELANEGSNWADLTALVHDDCLYTANGSERWTVNGSHAVLERWRAIHDAFPDMHAEIVNLVEGADTVAFELHVVENHTGEFVLPWATIPPTGYHVDEVMAYIVSVDGEGRAVRIAHYFDSGPLITAVIAMQGANR